MSRPPPSQKEEMGMREVDGIKVAFAEHDNYFAGFHTPSMGRIAKETGADVVMLLAPGMSETDLTDDEISVLLQAMNYTQPAEGEG